MKFVLRLTSVALAGAMVCVGPVASAALPSAPSPARSSISSSASTEQVVTITVETYDTAHHLVSTEVLGAADGAGVDESGSGGTPSASGCQKVTVNNYTRSLIFHTIILGYHTWTYWCWNRASYSVNSVSTNYYISHLDPTIDWVGEAARDLRYYAWLAGHSSSGYWHYRMGHFQQCYPWTCANLYPSNTLRSHSDGTWTWATT